MILKENEVLYSKEITQTFAISARQSSLIAVSVTSNFSSNFASLKNVKSFMFDLPIFNFLKLLTLMDPIITFGSFRWVQLKSSSSRLSKGGKISTLQTERFKHFRDGTKGTTEIAVHPKFNFSRSGKFNKVGRELSVIPPPHSSRLINSDRF